MKYIKQIYLTNHFFIALIIIITISVFGNFYPIMFAISKVLLILFICISSIDIALLFNRSKSIIQAQRICPKRLSNGDENKIDIYLQNNYNFNINVDIIDEIPHQFQERNFSIKTTLDAGTQKQYIYKLVPTKRGEYQFGNLNIYVSTKIGLIQRRFTFDRGTNTAVYPSFIQMRKYELMAISNRLTEAGIKKIRRITNNNEFEQIKKYIKGDDYRTINWKATARTSQLMTNQYQDEKAQQIISIVDMGRTMKMPFYGLTLLDHAINATLVISNIAILKQDRAGLITFSNKIETILPPNRKNNQITAILDALYKQQTNFAESNLELIYVTIKRNIKQRSLLFLYTNFEGLSSLQRQIKYFKQIAKHHLLVVVFFENIEVKKLLTSRPNSVEEVYIKTIAEKFIYEKKQMQKELNKYGIHSILSEPQNLSVNTINKYLELKSRALI